MLEFLFILFAIAFFLNLLWELWHSRLYETCHTMPLDRYVKLITVMSLKDAFWIISFYGITVLLFQNTAIFEKPFQLTAFITLALAFSFIDEKISLTRGRWSYAKEMPTILGVGLTPLFEVAMTGITSLVIVSRLIS